ncbi:hypothetical protein LTR10_020906 [Elasticomyces elasticus]|uniref:SDR family NAD(P)-dependent oxidoreductase n=1 Tax=Exophiala sideris TaxID=1016849 RepID=A0ABR0J085_9EURO|nr:hypothetical protein LTR10_020906 [Elasticomyces elasticus]KAK5023382.1 hypothetical protein LTS07_009257 [Exophiala sideris]KAK5028243.1 hypothetical protein LTR13_009231 [Exophiala sideris]KAK5052901.1 hypothetical protein LTR69_009727 [Exophiala sideris]KAK5178512.1 hypothetical protein LTR44_009137 [Eurotiomycetes sp. CCFEE 6388]
MALVTGAGGGLGLAITAAFAKEGAKAVAILDVLPDEVLAEAKKKVEVFGAQCLTIGRNVTVESEVERAHSEVVEKFGRIDYTA